MAAVDESGNHLGIGSAITKKQAEQLAAKQAISRLT
jgi:dsRNA-specific ribonuclease